MLLSLTPKHTTSKSKHYILEYKLMSPTASHTLTLASNPPYLPYTICQKQFPLQLAYSTTFNSCQGLTLDHVVIDCHEDIFTHGQLYTALTCIHHQSDATLFIPNFKQDVTNVVYKSLLPTQQSNNLVLMTNHLFAPPPLHITVPSSSTILF